MTDTPTLSTVGADSMGFDILITNRTELLVKEVRSRARGGLRSVYRRVDDRYDIRRKLDIGE